MSSEIIQNLRSLELPADTFCVEARSLNSVYPLMTALYGEERTFQVKSNWAEIFDYRYDIYSYLDLRVLLRYKQVPTSGRPQYSSSYFILGDLRRSRGSQKPVVSFQQELARLGISTTQEEAGGGKILLSENRMLSFCEEPSFESGYNTTGKDQIVLTEHFFKDDFVKWSWRPFPLKDARDFGEKVRLFETALEKLIIIRYALEGKHPPEAALVLTPSAEDGSQKVSATEVVCDYCSGHYGQSLGACPFCGGPKG